MTTRSKRCTVAYPVKFEGLGLHSGTPVGVVVEPGEQGIWFVCGRERVRAVPENVTDTSRCTRLGGVSTIEHMMAALAATGVTDAEVVLTAPELPALDGACAEYFMGLAAAGLNTIGWSSFSLFERVFFVEDPIRIAIAKGDGHWRFDFESGERWPFSQSFDHTFGSDDFASEVAPARTFAFEEEVAPLQAAGLAKGLSAESALVLGQEGYVNSPKWPDEPARHKLLDLVGDLYLSGVPPQFLSVVAVRSGHRTNVEAAKRLSQHCKIETA